MVNLLVAVGGPIASGKTTLSKELATVLGGDRRAFSDIVKAETVKRGRVDDRAGWQLTGDELVEEGWPAFVASVLTPAPDADVLVVDGIRHIGAIDELIRQLPSARTFLVFVDPPGESIVERVTARSESLDALFHHVEAELPAVRDRADLVVGGSDMAADIAAVRRLFA